DMHPRTTRLRHSSLHIEQLRSITSTAPRVTAVTSGTAVGINLLIPLQDRTSVSGSATHRDGRTDSYLAASKTLGAEAGAGWRVLSGRRSGQDYGEGGYYYQGSHGLVTADLSASSEQQAVRLGAQGGLVALDGEF